MKTKSLIFALGICLMLLSGCAATVGVGTDYGYYQPAPYYGPVAPYYARPYYGRPRPAVIVPARPYYRQPYQPRYDGGYRGGYRGGNPNGGYHGHSRSRY